MGVVERHELDHEHAERAVARLTARLHEAREDIETDTLGPGLAMDRSYHEFCQRCVADGRAAENATWLAMVRALQAGGALFLMATRPRGESVEFRYGEDTIRRAATGPTSDSTSLTWLRTMYLAIVARDRARVELLASVPIELLRACAPERDDFEFAWIRALQLFARGEDGLIDAVLQAMRDTEQLSPASVQEFVNVHFFPPMELFYHYTQRDQAKFDASLPAALDLHKRYWATDPRNEVGLVALAPLAVACLAHDAGMAIEVESDYLPHHPLVGTRVGEIST
ncbi:immunity protein 49 of polymorphic toxin system [Labedaea rhizosphaerae]|uniref:Immunity protein 49 of polymorphic toxin system n=1 Tax=Labedaea rhizosphaerae TaxID=598644 RepID=A0A4R6SGA6_LABRH|nr:immunity protein 49 of polymorphic toxin system [Labedaea rhizosphaerae]